MLARWQTVYVFGRRRKVSAGEFWQAYVAGSRQYLAGGASISAGLCQDGQKHVGKLAGARSRRASFGRHMAAARGGIWQAAQASRQASFGRWRQLGRHVTGNGALMFVGRCRKKILIFLLKVIRCNQMQSDAIRANQSQSETMRGNQRQSEAIGCTATTRGPPAPHNRSMRLAHPHASIVDGAPP